MQMWSIYSVLGEARDERDNQNYVRRKNLSVKNKCEKKNNVWDEKLSVKD
jgi:hypothetical protein